MATVYLLDIEGTICPIHFVKEVLYPYFSKKISSLVESKDESIKSLLAQFPQYGDLQSLQSHIQYLVEKDVKDPILKRLQGIVWSQGYLSGELEAPLYRDAIEFIKRQHKVYIYSSGSIQAQKLLFGHVANPDGGDSLDLNPLINGYFDINTSGGKLVSTSYENILNQIGVPAERVLFISDNVKELVAAHAAGVRGLLALRPGNATVQENCGFQTIKSFSIF